MNLCIILYTCILFMLLCCAWLYCTTDENTVLVSDCNLKLKCEAVVRYCFSMTVYFCQIIVHICMSKTCQQCGNHRDSESRPLLEASRRRVNGSAGSATEKESKSRNKFTADNETLQNKNYTSIA